MSDLQPVYRVANIDPAIKDFHCPTCKTVIGETNGSSLRIGGVAAFPFVVTFSCLRCGSLVKWRPVGNGNGKYNICDG